MKIINASRGVFFKDNTKKNKSLNKENKGFGNCVINNTNGNNKGKKGKTGTGRRRNLKSFLIIKAINRREKDLLD